MLKIKRGLLKNCASYLPSDCRVAIIADETVADLYGQALHSYLLKAELETHLFTFPSGEQSKTRTIKEQLEDRLFDKGLSRDTCIIALGGGVATDLAGFLAATFCRGVPLTLIPTTLLAMVDACVGGKTGVNTSYGKNLIGCIYRPEHILIDPIVLKTLPLAEFRNGMVEILKHALIADACLFDFLEKNAENLLSQDSDVLEYMIWRSCEIKSSIVQEDERERGKRRILNFGHTIGHALEKVSNYTLTHGEAVAIGILIESHMAMQLGFLPQCSLEKIYNLLFLFGLPLKLPSVCIPSLIETMARDKKSLQGRPRFVLIREIGCPLSFNGTYCTPVDTPYILNALNWTDTMSIPNCY